MANRTRRISIGNAEARLIIASIIYAGTKDVLSTRDVARRACRIIRKLEGLAEMDASGSYICFYDHHGHIKAVCATSDELGK